MTLIQLFSGIPTAAWILFGVGVILAMLEFFTPGFGVSGTTAILCFLASIVVVMASAGSLLAGLIFVAIVLVVIAALIIVFSVFASRGKFIRPLMLRDELGTQGGFSSSRDLSALCGKTGESETILRPAGRAKIDDESYSVVTRGEFIPAGRQVEVVEVSGSRVVVRAVGT